MTELLAGGDARFRVCAARLAELQPATRALIAYELAGPCGRRRRIFAKHYADPARASRLHDTLVALYDEAATRRLAFAVPRPLGWFRDLNLALYAAVEGPFLDGLLRRGRAAASPARRAGMCLAQLHSCGPPLDRRFDLATERVNLGAWASLVDRELPGAGASELADAFARAALAASASAPAPLHKDFHPRHVVVGRRLGIIDLDEMRWGDPSFDIAHFCAYLDLLGLRADLGDGGRAALRRAFVEGYAREAGASHGERTALFGVYACVKIARQLCTLTGVRPVPTGAERRRQVRAILDRGRELSRALA
jgi:hypothetical protein